jgi:hypothetical protein
VCPCRVGAINRGHGGTGARLTVGDELERAPDLVPLGRGLVLGVAVQDVRHGAGGRSVAGGADGEMKTVERRGGGAGCYGHG